MANNAIAFGFTMAELLIVLAILGEIAVFTIPKIVNSQQNKKHNTIAHEAAGMIMDAYQQHKLRGLLTSDTTSGDLTQYMNYVRVYTGSLAVDTLTGGNLACSVTTPCLRLHSGAILAFNQTESFGGTGAKRVIRFFLDPDGTRNFQNSAYFMVTYPGRFTDDSNCTDPSYVSSLNTINCWGAAQTPWLSW